MNPTLTGEAMPAWSDLDGTPGPARGAALAPLVATATGRTLVVGPHDPALLDAVPADRLTLLVRGVPDAEALAARYADRPGATVTCGSLAALTADPAYDTVIALDGLGRLSSAEGADLSWGAAFERLVGALAPGGTVLLGVENLLGLHRLVALPTPPTDGGWSPADEYDPTRPAGLPGVREALAAGGLDVTRAYAAFPSPVAPTVLAGTGILADPDLRGYLAAVLAGACAPLSGVLTDPARLVTRALRHGAADTLAPAWILSARRPSAAAPSALPARSASPVSSGLPEVCAVGAAGRSDVHRAAGGGWIRRTGGDTSPVPAGPTLADVLLSRVARHEMPAVRELLRTWQDGDAADVAADGVVVGPDGGLTALWPAGEPGAALRAFAATLVRSGLGAAWPAATGPELAETLARMAGTDLGQASGHPDSHAFDELAAERDRLTAELAAARAKARWYEETLSATEGSLREARRTVELLSATGPARLGRALVGGARAARRSARAVRRHLRTVAAR
ncbi:MAG TPA: hypothetical protein VGN37_03205 [Actinocatenispora sp.]